MAEQNRIVAPTAVAQQIVEPTEHSLRIGDSAGSNRSFEPVRIGASTGQAGDRNPTNRSSALSDRYGNSLPSAGNSAQEPGVIPRPLLGSGFDAEPDRGPAIHNQQLTSAGELCC